MHWHLLRRSARQRQEKTCKSARTVSVLLDPNTVPKRTVRLEFDLLLYIEGVVFQGPVRSGYVPFLALTVTETG